MYQAPHRETPRTPSKCMKHLMIKGPNLHWSEMWRCLVCKCIEYWIMPTSKNNSLTSKLFLNLLNLVLWSQCCSEIFCTYRKLFLFELQMYHSGFDTKHVSVTGLEEYWSYKFKINAATVKGNITSEFSSIFTTKQARE